MPTTVVASDWDQCWKNTTVPVCEKKYSGEIFIQKNVWNIDYHSL